MAWETGVQSQVESYQRLKKWYLMPPCLTLSIIRYGSRVKWNDPRKGVAPFYTLWCSSYWKGRLRVTLDYGRQLYLLLLIYIYIYIYIYSKEKGKLLQLPKVQRYYTLILSRRAGNHHFDLKQSTQILHWS